MTVQEVVSIIRSRIKAYSDDTDYPDKVLWDYFRVRKNNVLADRVLRRYFTIDQQNYQTICLELEEGLSHECGCITYGCEVLKTIKNLPEYLVGRNMPTLRVMLLDGRIIDAIEEQEYEEVIKYDPILSKKILYSIVNNRVVLWNAPKTLKAIQVRAIWSDVTELDSVQYCNDNDPTVPNCINFFDTNIGLQEELISYTIDLVLERDIFPSLNIIKDSTNDASSTIKI
jgi:hypothetical protein